MCKRGIKGDFEVLRDNVDEKREGVRISPWLEMIRYESFDIATQSLEGEENWRAPSLTFLFRFFRVSCESLSPQRPRAAEPQ